MSSSSEEEGEEASQAAVRAAIRERVNCVVAANPGTGKTTTVLSAAEQLPSRAFLVLTYNNSLQADTIKSAAARGLTNVEVCTYHQLVRTYYDTSVCDDWGLLRVLRARGLPVQPSDRRAAAEWLGDVKPVGVASASASASTATERPNFDVLVVDESQDMCRLYFLVAAMLAMDAARPFQLVVMGDVRQGVYSFRGADTRYLSLAERLWRGFARLARPDAWTTVVFRVTHRLTPSICRFLNADLVHSPAALGGDDQQQLEPSAAARARDAPLLVCVDTTANCVQFVLSCIRQLQTRPGVQLHDIAVLCPSLQDMCVKRVAQQLAIHGTPVFVPGAAETSADAAVSENRVRFYTFWSAKGLTVRYAIVINANNSFFSMRGGDGARCPAPHFVAFTRASHALTLVFCHEPLTTRPEAQQLPPYLRESFFYATAAAPETETETAPPPPPRLFGARVHLAMAQSVLQPASGEREPPPPAPAADAPPPPPSKKKTRALRRQFDVSRLCAFLSSDFIAEKLLDIYDWFERRVVVPEDRLRAAELTPSRTVNAFGHQEDVSDLNGKVAAYYGFDFLRNRRQPLVFEEHDEEEEEEDNGFSIPIPASVPTRKRALAHEDCRAEALEGSETDELGGLDSAVRSVSLGFTTAVMDEPGSNARELSERLDAARLRPRTTAADYVNTVCVLEAVRSGLYHRALHFDKTQMNWMHIQTIQLIESVVRAGVRESSRYQCEKPFHVTLTPDLGAGEGPQQVQILLRGCVDLLTDSALMEWKYKSTLQLEDFLQLLVYLYAHRRAPALSSSSSRSAQLLNLRTGELFTLRPEYEEQALRAVEHLFLEKLTLDSSDSATAAESALHGGDEHFCLSQSLAAWTPTAEQLAEDAEKLAWA